MFKTTKHFTKIKLDHLRTVYKVLCAVSMTILTTFLVMVLVYEQVLKVLIKLLDE